MTQFNSTVACSPTSPSSKVSPEEFVETVRETTETFLKSVMETVNAALDGSWIEGSEEGVRDLAAEFRQRVFELAVQERVDAAEAAFSPSGGNSDSPGHATVDEKETA